MHHHFAGPLAGALTVAALLVAGCGPAGSGGSGGSGGGANGAGSGGSQPGTSAGGSGSTAAAGTTLFPIAVGEKWVYADDLGSLGSGTTTNTITAVQSRPHGHLVTMTDSGNLPGASGKIAKLTYMFYDNGSIGVPFTQLSGAKVTIKSGSIVWPPFTDIQSGQPQRSTLRIALSVAGHNVNEAVHVTVRGAGTHGVTVPAGHYQATVVDESLAEKVMGFPVNVTVRTWLAPGVGPVKSEVLSKAAAGSATSITDVLKSFTK
jgi:uncharacterized protein DUF3108